MKNFLVALLIFLLWSIFALWLYWWLQPRFADSAATARNQEVVSDTIRVEEVTDSLTTDTLEIDRSYLQETADLPQRGLKATSLDGELLFLYPRGFTIIKNQPQVIVPEQLQNFALELKEEMDSQPETELHIYSQYSPSEDIFMPNLGVQRARQVRRMLINTGIPADRLVIKPQINPISFETDNTYTSSFSFALKPLDSIRLNAERLELPQGRIIYPTYTIDGVLVNKELKDFAGELRRLLQEDPGLHLEVIGHTDNVGNAQDNYLKGLDHARQVRWYLVKRAGIDRRHIRARSKGETEAIASNGSKNGRDLNRRIEIKFYQDDANELE